MLRLCNELMAVQFRPPQSRPSQVLGGDLYEGLCALLLACSARPFVFGVDWKLFLLWRSGLGRSLAGSLGFSIQFSLAAHPICRLGLEFGMLL